MSSLKPVQGGIPDRAAIAEVGHISNDVGYVAEDGERKIKLDQVCLNGPNTPSTVSPRQREMLIREAEEHQANLPRLKETDAGKND